MTTKIKICGLQNLEDVLDAIELGADYLGFVFDPNSEYFLDPDACQNILEEVPGQIQKVGVFADADVAQVQDVGVMLGLDLVQLDGQESPEYCSELARPVIKSFYPQNSGDLEKIKAYSCDYLLIESSAQKAYGSAGLIGNWDLVRDAGRQRPIFLSGHLDSDNVVMAIQAVRPFAVNVRAGVEREGRKKDYSKIQEFVQRVRHCGKPQTR